MDMVLSIDEEEDGEYKAIDLVEKGEEQSVTNQKKKKNMFRCTLTSVLLNQICAFGEGFDSLTIFMNHK